MAYATSADVAVRLARTLSGPEVAAASTLLDDAEQHLVVGIPSLHEQATADPDYHSRVVQVESAMVARVLRNPGGYRTTAEGSGVDTRAAAGFLLVLSDEWTLLGGTGDSGVFTIAPTLGLPEASASPW